MDNKTDTEIYIELLEHDRDRLKVLLYDSQQEVIYAKAEMWRHAHLLYKDLEQLPILNEYEQLNELKFVIQRNCWTDVIRFIFDPYQLVENTHCRIASLWNDINWSNKGGGVLKAFDNKIILYSGSEEFRAYNESDALSAAKLVFQNNEIFSYVGKKWEEIEMHFSTTKTDSQTH